MAILVHKLKSLNPKKAMAVVLLAGLAAFAISYFPVSASGPQFNIFPISYTGELNHDLPMIDARNVTQNGQYSVSQADHDNGVSANPNDVIQVSVYYHNGAADAPENTAISTVVKAFLNPSQGTAATTHRVSATVGASNAATVSSSSSQRGGDINININGEAQSLSLVPGSVVLYPNQGSSPAGTPISLPDTVLTSGVNIGDVRGCFDFHGFVNFRLKVSNNVEPPPGQLQIQKNVKNVTKNTSFNSTEVSADPGDTVEYQIIVSATNNSLSNVIVRDQLGGRLTLSGNVNLIGTDSIDALQFFNTGVNIGTVSPSLSREIRFQAKVASASSFTPGQPAVLTNVAYATSGTTTVSDGANVRVLVPIPDVIACVLDWNDPLVNPPSDLRGLRKFGDLANVNIRVTGVPNGDQFTIVNRHTASGFEKPSLPIVNNYDKRFEVFSNDELLASEYGNRLGDYTVSVDYNGQRTPCGGFKIRAAVQELSVIKDVKNDTTGTGFSNQVDAKPGQLVTFKVVVSSSGSDSVIYSVNLNDTLPNKLTLVPGSILVDGVTYSGGLNGIVLGNFNPGQTKTITFRSQIAGAANFSVGVCENLVNTAEATGQTVEIPISGDNSIYLSDSDSATVHVCKDAPTKQPGSPSIRPN